MTTARNMNNALLLPSSHLFTSRLPPMYCYLTHVHLTASCHTATITPAHTLLMYTYITSSTILLHHTCSLHNFLYFIYSQLATSHMPHLTVAIEHIFLSYCYPCRFASQSVTPHIFLSYCYLNLSHLTASFLIANHVLLLPQSVTPHIFLSYC